MAGLDNIKHFQSGGSSGEDSSETKTEPTAPLTSQAAKVTGPYALPTPKGLVGVDPALLENMQQLIKDRETKRNSFMENLKDANAWWSGGVAGPGEALRARAAEREGQDATTFGMKSQLAQYKTAQAAAANRAKSLKEEVSGGTPGAPGATVNVNGVQMPVGPAREIQRLLSLDPPDLAGAEEIRKSWAKNETKFDAARHEQKLYFINGENVNLTPDEYVTYKATGKLPGANAAPTTSQTLPHTKPIEKVSAPTNTTVQAATPTANNILGANANTAISAGVPVISGYRPESKQAELQTASLAPGYKGPPVAPPGQSLHQTDEAIDVDFKNLKPEQKKWLKDNGYVQTLPDKDPNHFAKLPLLGNVSTASAQNVSLPSQKAELMSTKTASPATAALPYPTPRNSKEVEANQEYIKKRSEKELDIISKGPEKASTEAGVRQAQMFKLNEDADKAIEAADIVIAASKSHPESVGLGKGFTGTNALTTAISILPKMDQAKAEERVASFQLKPEALVARDQVDTASKQLGISFAADVFKGARMGIGLENMAAGAKGVSVHNMAENNLINATLIKEAALFNKARTDMFTKWAEKNGGKLADFEKFETSPEYIALKEQTQKRLVDSLPNYLKLGKNGLVEKNAKESEQKSEPSKFDKFKKKKQD
jgi:hypothetical protein